MRILLVALVMIALVLVAVVVVVVQPALGAGRVLLTSRSAPDLLEEHVRKLAVDFHPRDHLHTDNLDRTADYIAVNLASAGGRVSRQPYEVAGRTYQNVRALFGPEDGRRIVVGAHYDVCGEQPGADDNASAVAGLLEIARLLSDVELTTQVELVAYSLEEPPYFRSEHMGSAVHARQVDPASVSAMICLEMLGYFSDEPGSQSFPAPLMGLFYPTTGDFIAVVGRMGEGRLARRIKRAMRATSSVSVRSINGPSSIPGVDFSDHQNYWARDIPAVMVTDTSFFRNPHYHQVTDTPETLDYARMAQVVDGVMNALLELAGTPE